MTPAIELVVANAPDAAAALFPFLSAKIPTVSVPTWKHMYIPTHMQSITLNRTHSNLPAYFA